MSLESTNSTNIPPTTSLLVGASWDKLSQKSSLKEDVDLDLSCIVVNQYSTSSSKIIDRVFWGKLQAFDGAIEHSGDNETGEGAGDDEQITIHDFTKLPSTANAIFFFISKYSEDCQIFPQNNLVVRVLESKNEFATNIDKVNFIELKGLHSVFSRGIGSFCFCGCVRQNNNTWEVVELAMPVDVTSALDAQIEKHVDFLLQSCLSGGMRFVQDNKMSTCASVSSLSAAAASSPSTTSRDDNDNINNNITNNNNRGVAVVESDSQNNSPMENDSSMRSRKGAAAIPDGNSCSAPAPSPSGNSQPDHHQQQQQPSQSDFTQAFFVLLIIVMFFIPIYFAV